MVQQKDTELTSSHGYTTNTLFTERLLMKKVGSYQDRSSTTKGIRKEPQQGVTVESSPRALGE